MEHLTLIDYISVGWVSIGLILTVIAIIRDSRIQKKIQNSIYNHYQNNDMDYEQKYKEALDWARKVYPHTCGKEKEDLERVFPDLKESEDERIRKAIVEHFKAYSKKENIVSYYGVATEDIIAYLEKKKENPKSADSIPSDCTSDAKYEDRWHKVGDFLPDNGKEVLAKDKLGNILLARYDGEGWDVSVYDDEDYRCHNGISKWCEIPSEEQKEQKPSPRIYWHAIKEGDTLPCRAYLWTTNYEKYHDCFEGRLIPNVENVTVGADMWYLPVDDVYNLPREGVDELPKEQKQEAFRIPATLSVGMPKTQPSYKLNVKAAVGWSEEDKKIIGNLRHILNVYAFEHSGMDVNGDYIEQNYIDADNWLKSLRQQPHWKPSEEQMEALYKAASHESSINKENANYLYDLYYDLKKLM